MIGFVIHAPAALSSAPRGSAKTTRQRPPPTRSAVRSDDLELERPDLPHEPEVAPVSRDDGSADRAGREGAHDVVRESLGHRHAEPRRLRGALLGSPRSGFTQVSARTGRPLPSLSFRYAPQSHEATPRHPRPPHAGRGRGVSARGAAVCRSRCVPRDGPVASGAAARRESQPRSSFHSRPLSRSACTTSGAPGPFCTG